MADTGFKVTGTVVADAWTLAVTTTRINTSNNVEARALGTTYLVAQLEDFTFGIPAGATVDGIEATAEFKASGAGVVASIRLSLSWDNGSTFTATKTSTVTGTTDTVRTYGGATDTWGRTWSPDTEMADGTFRIKLEGKADGVLDDCRLDHLQIKVYYTTAAGVMSVIIF